MKTKITAFAIFLLMAASICLPACGPETPEGGDGQKNIQASEESGTAENGGGANSRESIPDNLPEKDYGGYEFRFYTNPGNILESAVNDRFAPEAEIGEVVNDAVFRRNRLVEERFGVNIKTIDSGGDYVQHTSKVKNSVLTGDDAFDVAFVHVVTGPNLTLENVAYNLLEIPQFDFGKPWWQKQTNEELALAGKMFLGSNSIFYAGLSGTHVMYFNRQKIADYGLDMPYESVFAGTWTYDELISMTKDVYEDLNGNGQKDREDFYGYVGLSLFAGLWTSCDIPVLEKGGDEILTIGVNTEKTINLIDKIYDWYYNSPGVLAEPDYSTDWQKDIFADNRGMFVLGEINDAPSKFVASEVEYGIVPLPKYDTAQENYRSFSGDQFFMVPQTASVESLERAGTILEAMSAEGYKKIIPAYYEIALKNKYLQDEDSIKVLDLINDSRTISFAYIYDNWEGFAHMGNDLFGGKPTNDFASYYEKRLKSAQKRVDAIIRGFTEN